MSPIFTLRQWLRALNPALLAPHAAISGTEPVNAGAEPDAAAHPLGQGRCWLAREHGFAHRGGQRGTFVDAGESYYAVSRERTLVRAICNGWM